MSGWAVTYWCPAWCLTCQSMGLCSGWGRGDAQTRPYRSSEDSLIGWTQCLSQGWWPCLHLLHTTERKKNTSLEEMYFLLYFFYQRFFSGINNCFSDFFLMYCNIIWLAYRQTHTHWPICLIPSLSSMSSCTRGISMCSRGPWGGPFTGVSKLRLFLLLQVQNNHRQTHTNTEGKNVLPLPYTQIM